MDVSKSSNTFRMQLISVKRMWDQRGRKRATKIISPESQGKPDPTIEERIINSNEFVPDCGHGVPVDKAKAYYLYERSLSLANSEVEIA